MKIAKTDAPGYEKILDHGWVINNNDGELRMYKQQKERSREIRNLQQNQEKLHIEVMAIKSMLKEIIEKIGK